MFLKKFSNHLKHLFLTTRFVSLCPIYISLKKRSNLINGQVYELMLQAKHYMCLQIRACALTYICRERNVCQCIDYWRSPVHAYLHVPACHFYQAQAVFSCSCLNFFMNFYISKASQSTKHAKKNYGFDNFDYEGHDL